MKKSSLLKTDCSVKLMLQLHLVIMRHFKDSLRIQCVKSCYLVVKLCSSFARPPSAKHTSELRWPAHTNLDISFPFSSVGLFEDVGVQQTQ